MIVSRPVVSSIRSRQTGHVGSSINDGVGGASGFVESVAEPILPGCDGDDTLVRWPDVAGCDGSAACCFGDIPLSIIGSTP